MKGVEITAATLNNHHGPIIQICHALACFLPFLADVNPKVFSGQNDLF